MPLPEIVTMRGCLEELTKDVDRLNRNPAVPGAMKSALTNLRYTLICMATRIETLEQLQERQCPTQP